MLTDARRAAIARENEAYFSRRNTELHERRQDARRNRHTILADHTRATFEETCRQCGEHWPCNAAVIARYARMQQHKAERYRHDRQDAHERSAPMLTPDRRAEIEAMLDNLPDAPPGVWFVWTTREEESAIIAYANSGPIMIRELLDTADYWRVRFDRLAAAVLSEDAATRARILDRATPPAATPSADPHTP